MDISYWAAIIRHCEGQPTSLFWRQTGGTFLNTVKADLGWWVTKIHCNLKPTFFVGADICVLAVARSVAHSISHHLRSICFRRKDGHLPLLQRSQIQQSRRLLRRKNNETQSNSNFSLRDYFRRPYLCHTQEGESHKKQRKKRGLKDLSSLYLPIKLFFDAKEIIFSSFLFTTPSRP